MASLFIWSNREACGILAPWPRMEPMPPAVGAWSLSPSTTREVPIMACWYYTTAVIFKKCFNSEQKRNMFWTMEWEGVSNSWVTRSREKLWEEGNELVTTSLTAVGSTVSLNMMDISTPELERAFVCFFFSTQRIILHSLSRWLRWL